MEVIKYNSFEILILHENPVDSQGDVQNHADGVKVYDLTGGYRSSTNITVTVTNQEFIVTALVLASGGASSMHANAYLLDSDRLILCAGPYLVALHLPSLELDWQIQSDSASCFGVHKIPGAYIVHGELEISRVSYEGQIVWSHGGRDIFTTPVEFPVFSIEGSCIHVKDWNGDEYRFSFEGEDLSLSKEKSR